VSTETWSIADKTRWTKPSGEAATVVDDARSTGAFNSGKWASKGPRLDSTTLLCHLGQVGGRAILSNRSTPDRPLGNPFLR
jgi:hypothetical protein